MEKILTLKEIAQYIKLNERTVLKLANNNEIPAKKIGNQWRFVLSKVNFWLSHQIDNVDTSDLNGLIATNPNIIPISRLIVPELVNLHLKSDNNKGIIEELSNIPLDAGILENKDEFFNAMSDRESMMSTALSNGFAIPHPRYPIKGLFPEPRVIFGMSKNGTDFGAIDGTKSHFFFVSCATCEVSHLRILAKLGKLFKSDGIKDKLMGLTDKDDFFRILLEFESF